MPRHLAALKLLEQMPAPPPPSEAPEAEIERAVVPPPEPVPVPEATPVSAPVPPPPDPRVAEAVALSAAALRHFVKDEHDQARQAVEKALALDPGNRRARELQKILRVLR